jgi:LysR family nitrogen assimilation transcriptional regulator
MHDTLLRMRLFVAVYEEHSLTAAAAREHLTQSGVTHHIQRLEEHLGVQLLVRSQGGVRATPAGEQYYKACIEVLRTHAASRAALEPFRGSTAGLLQLGLTPSITRTVLAPTLAEFVESFPNVSVHVTDAYSDVIIDKVRRGELDCGIVPSFMEMPGIRCTHFATSPEVLVCGANHSTSVSQGAPLRLAELGPLRLVMPSRAQARRSKLDVYLALSGANVERRLEIDSSLGALDFVAQSDWISILPAVMMLHEMSRSDFRVYPLSPALYMDLFCIERTRDPVMRELEMFLGILKSHAGRVINKATELTSVGTLA